MAYRPGITAATLTGRYNDLHRDIASNLTMPGITAYGAVGDGAIHTVDSVIGATIAGYSAMSSSAKLSAIQNSAFAVAPYVTSLSDTMDLVAFWAAAAAAVAAGGGEVRVSAGTYMMNRALPPIPFSDMLEGDRQPTYSVRGEGRSVVALKFFNDVAAGAHNYDGTWAWEVQNRVGGSTSGYQYDTSIEGVTLEGPPSSTTYGSKVCNLSGLGWGARLRLRDVAVKRFHIGIGFQGDQTHIHGLLAYRCTFGLMWDIPNSGLYGDFEFHNASILECTVAGVACSPSVNIPRAVWNKCIFGVNPVHFAKLTAFDAPNGWNPSFLYGHVFIQPQFENTGYAAFAELDPATLRPTGFAAQMLTDCQMLQADFGPWFPDCAFPGTAPSAVIGEGQVCLGRNLIDLAVEGNMTPGVNGIWNFMSTGVRGGNDHTLIRGQIDLILTNLRAVTTTTGNARSIFFGPNCDPTQLFLEAPSWSGFFSYDYTGDNPQLGAVVALRNGAWLFGPANGTQADANYGGGVAVCMHQRTDGGIASHYALLAYRGVVKVLTPNNLTDTHPTRTGASGPVDATGLYDTTSAIVGWPVDNSPTPAAGSPYAGAHTQIRLLGTSFVPPSF